jgi:hypothetical protein
LFFGFQICFVLHVSNFGFVCAISCYHCAMTRRTVMSIGTRLVFAGACAAAACGGEAGRDVAPAPPAPAAPSPLDIRPDPSAAWRAPIEDVERVLRAAAGELWAHVPDRRLPPIRVEPKGGPIALHQRGPRGEIRVRLDTGETYGAQYTCQFAHE